MASPTDALVAARSWLMNVFVHNHAEQLRINRDVQRKKLNVAQEDYPYPGAVQGSNNPTTINNSAAGYVKGAVLAAGLLLGGGAGAVGLTKMMTPATVAPVAPVSPATPTVPTAQDYDAVYEEQQPDGSWTLIKREHLKGAK